MNTRTIPFVIGILASGLEVSATFATTPPDPPQLALSCAYTTQTSLSTVITCTVTAPDRVTTDGVTVTASPYSGTPKQVSLGSMTGGSTGQAVFSYSGSGFAGLIRAQGAADQPVAAKSLEYKAANQPLVVLQATKCVTSAVIADGLPYPATGGSGSVNVTAPSGCHSFVSLAPNSLTGLTVLDYGGGAGSRSVPLTIGSNIMPDLSTSTRTWNLLVNDGAQLLAVTPPATQAGLTCVFQPSTANVTAPVNGGVGSISMSVGPNCLWSSISDNAGIGGFVRFIQPPLLGQPYLSLPTCCTTGPGTVYYVVDGNNGTTGRTFTLHMGGKTINGQQAGPGPAPPTLACPSNNATKGLVYSSLLTAGAGEPPYTFAITGGALPAGLALDGQTGAIKGTPTGPGTATFTAQVTDSRGSGVSGASTSQSCTITVDQCTFTISGPADVPGLSQYAYQINLPTVFPASNIKWTVDKSTASIVGFPNQPTETVIFENTQPDWVTLKANFTLAGPSSGSSQCAVKQVALVQVRVGTLTWATDGVPKADKDDGYFLVEPPAHGAAPKWITTYTPGSAEGEFTYNGDIQEHEPGWLENSSMDSDHAPAVSATARVTLTSPPEKKTAQQSIQVGLIQGGSDTGSANYSGALTRTLVEPTSTTVDWLSTPPNPDDDLWPWYGVGKQATGDGENTWNHTFTLPDSPVSRFPAEYYPNDPHADPNAHKPIVTGIDTFGFVIRVGARTKDQDQKADTYYFDEAHSSWTANFAYKEPVPNVSIVTHGGDWQTPTEPSEISVNVVPTVRNHSIPFKRWNPATCPAAVCP